ncbi:uncharacterized protein ACA1_136840 [Acanthamoeba castellanii str. Neff]|uniref:Uncharacterized protein n=1 Tax=Acanthamoeba castellanii (strain ATCC 30010 / Neff) TaxID=1257118 RepID=L8H0S3_ACACF|nr:uncharacterized protein ACA1_136840 [Acanthamoeba castellanii str. Neff]ELR18373.1 hypothetical protein ACA1_136840 [Acanthamoeba castellanii str. Neff]
MGMKCKWFHTYEQLAHHSITLGDDSTLSVNLLLTARLTHCGLNTKIMWTGCRVYNNITQHTGLQLVQLSHMLIGMLHILTVK